MEDLLIMVLWNGVQSLNNQKFYVREYDEKERGFVSKWVVRPTFLDACINKAKTGNNEIEHTEQ